MPFGESRVLYFNRRVPTDVIRSAQFETVFGGVKVWKRSLGSSDWKQARTNYHLIATEFEQLVAVARAGAKKRLDTPSHKRRARRAEASDQEWIAQRVYLDILAPTRKRHAEAFRSWDTLHERVEALENAFPDATEWNAYWDRRIALAGNEDEIDEKVAEFAEWLGLSVATDDDVSLIRRAVVQGRRRAFQKLKESDYLSPLDDEDADDRETPPPKRQTLSDVLDEYKAAGKRDEKWLRVLAVNVEEFEEFLGNPKPINRISRSDIQLYVEALQRAPANRKQRFPGLTLKQAIEANERREEPYEVIGKTTIEDTKLAALRTLFQFAMDQRAWITVNPTHRLKVSHANDKDKSKRAISGSELTVLFSHPIWSGCSDLAHPHNPGDLKIDDHRYWAPLVLLYTGCRPKEIAAVKISEIDISSSTPHIRIRANEFGGLKTGNAKRDIPLVDALKSLGFFDYVRRLQAKGEVRLFPGWEAGGTHKEYAQADWVRAFNRTVVPAQFGLDASSQIGLYSLRKCFKRLLTTSGVNKQVQDELMGHAVSDVEQAYLGRLGVSETHKLVRSLQYEGFVFPRDRSPASPT